VTAFYFDEHMKRAVAKALIESGHPAQMAVDAGMEGKWDEEHLAFATERNLVMVTFDRPFAGRTQSRSDFYGLVCLDPGLQRDVGRIIEILVEFAQLFDAEKDTGQVYWMKLKVRRTVWGCSPR